MGKNSKEQNYFLKNTYDSNSIMKPIETTYALTSNSQYQNLSIEMDSKRRLHIESNVLAVNNKVYMDSMLEKVAQWFLNMSSMSNKKLQKMCYYAYCWFIVFYNDIELVKEENANEIRVLFDDRFQAWIHGPVSPKLYRRYKKYGWQEIPKISDKIVLPEELEELLQQVWVAYGDFSADELEFISHGEMPWQNARKGYTAGDACSNEISNYDILLYYSSLE